MPFSQAPSPLSNATSALAKTGNRWDGAVLVKRLFLYGEDQVQLAAFLRAYGIDALPWLNRAERSEVHLTARQILRIKLLYAKDFALIEKVRATRSAFVGLEPWSEAFGIAAE